MDDGLTIMGEKTGGEDGRKNITIQQIYHTSYRGKCSRDCPEFIFVPPFVPEGQ